MRNPDDMFHAMDNIRCRPENSTSAESVQTTDTVPNLVAYFQRDTFERSESVPDTPTFTPSQRQFIGRPRQEDPHIIARPAATAEQIDGVFAMNFGLLFMWNVLVYALFLVGFRYYGASVHCVFNEENVEITDRELLELYYFYVVMFLLVTVFLTFFSMAFSTFWRHEISSMNALLKRRRRLIRSLRPASYRTHLSWCFLVFLAAVFAVVVWIINTETNYGSNWSYAFTTTTLLVFQTFGFIKKITNWEYADIDRVVDSFSDKILSEHQQESSEKLMEIIKNGIVFYRFVCLVHFYVPMQ